MKKNYDELPRIQGNLMSERSPHVSERKRNDPERCVEAAVRYHKDRIERGSIPAFIIDRKLVNYMTGCQSFSDLVLATDAELINENQKATLLGEVVVKSCFAYLNELLGPTPHGRSLQIVRNLPWKDRVGTYSYTDGVSQSDSFKGLTVHVQGSVYKDRKRLLTIGLRPIPSLDMPRQEYSSVEQGSTGQDIWAGTVQEGDVTILNSGICIENGQSDAPMYLQSVHQFQTPRRFNDGDAATTFGQFIENQPPNRKFS